MPTCREVTLLISEGLDRELPWRRRFVLWLHLLLCRSCSRFARQLRSLHAAIRQHVAAGESTAGESLSAQARERIRQRLDEENF